MDLKKAKEIAGYPQLSTTPVLRAAYQLLVDAGSMNMADSIARYLKQRYPERDQATMPKNIYGDTISPAMTEYRVTWTQAGSNKGLRVLFVRTLGNKGDAEDIARDYIERKHGLASIVIRTVSVAQPVPEGSVREGKGNE